ncbi:MAG: hypothetical protein JXB49_31335 [Bacteroidales bacterium]|nr:hypothetical protein [Bacteroidales bacterium]
MMIEKQIIKRIDVAMKGAGCKVVTKEWKKLSGDICNRVFGHFIKESIYPSYQVSEPNAYIKGFPTEFDLLIINPETKPVDNTNCYDPDDIKCAIEFKAQGIFAPQKDLKSKLDRMKETYQKINEKHPNINFIYLTLEEVANPVRKNSFNYFKETVEGLKPYSAFCLKNSRGNKEIRYGEWGKFIKAILKS